MDRGLDKNLPFRLLVHIRSYRGRDKRQGRTGALGCNTPRSSSSLRRTHAEPDRMFAVLSHDRSAGYPVHMLGNDTNAVHTPWDRGLGPAQRQTRACPHFGARAVTS